MLRKQHLVDANGSRAWPLDDSATTASDDGVLLPPVILVDGHLRYPIDYGRRPFLSALSLTPSLVTVIVEAAVSESGPGVAIASLSVRRSVAARGTPLSVSSFVDGVGGWLTFGPEVLDAPNGSYRFSSPRQSLLSPRCARPYRKPPVSSIAKLLSAGLKDVVSLRGIGSMTVDVEEREIESAMRDAVVFRLRNRDQGPTATANLNLLSDFSGRCGGRPESKTCGAPEPIEFISSVGPDCDGVLTIEFTGCAEIARLADKCGVFVACDVGLEDVCADPYLPDGDGRLPGEYDPETIIPEPEPEPEPEPGESESPGEPPEFPYIDCFDDGVAHDFSIEAGDFGIEAADSVDEVCPDVSEGESEGESEGVDPALSLATTGDSSASVRNVIVWEGGDVTTSYRRCTTTLKTTDGPVGARHNVGIVVNFHPHPTIEGRHTYWLAEIDCDSSVFRLRRWNGTAYATISTVTIPALTTGDWYRLSVDVVPDLDVGQTTLTINLEGVDDPTVVAQIGPVFIANYTPSNGLFGFHADRAESYWSYFMMEELP